MLSANPHQQPASLTTVSTSRQAVVPAPARPTLEEPIHLPSLDRGVFESRFEPDDPYKRSAFDRIIAARITNDLSLYGVIDGHGTSSLCAEYLAESLPMVVKLLLEGKTTKAGDEAALSNNYFTQVLREAFRICSKEWDGSSQIRSNAHYRHSGAVAFVALINHKNNFMFTANAGDCRCLVSQASGRGWRFLNPAHRTDNVHERMRILHQGGRIRSVNGVPRVQGALIPTRVFGDVELKIDFFGRMKPFLDPEPDLATFELVPSSHPHSNGSTRNHHQESVHKEGKNVAKSHWAVLASDGLWDSLETEAIVDMCREAVANGKQPEDLAKSLGKTAMQLTDDDVSVMVLMW